jgi:uncharacterized protein (DUF433 family)/predicted XRE-type DNA-binding protein
MVGPLPRITVDPAVCGGQPCVRGLRIPVSLVLKYLAAGKNAAEIVDELPELEPEDIGECLRSMRERKADPEPVDAGSGDVLVDLGFPDAAERRLRVQLALRLNELIAALGLTQARAAQRFGIPQPHVSELKHYKLNWFSSERLLRFVTLLDRDVEIIIRPKAEGHASGVVQVSVA